jgi:hypothetical protein
MRKRIVIDGVDFTPLPWWALRWIKLKVWWRFAWRRWRLGIFP